MQRLPLSEPETTIDNIFKEAMLELGRYHLPTLDDVRETAVLLPYLYIYSKGT